jgi:hypothetical protein
MIRLMSLVGVALLLTSCATGPRVERMYHSRVLFKAPGAERVDGKIKTKVGHRFYGRMEPFIGWGESPIGGGGVTIVDSYVKDPEYAYWGDIPTGLNFDARTGVIQGVPTQRGTWVFKSAVRDKHGLHAKYGGEGDWGTTESRVSGDPNPWAISKFEEVIVVE